MASGKVDNRGSFGSKRSRSDTSRNDGDWTCLKCGNVNFGFRTVCNRGKCGTARPPVTLAAPITSPYNQPPPYYFGGVGAASHMPVGLSNRYGPPVQLPGIHYNYGAPGSAHGSYGLITPFPPGPLRGMVYGSAPPINVYGYGFQGSPWAGGGISDNNASRKRRGGPDGLSEGDWVCPKCDNVNFAFRTTCNMKKCGTAKPSPGPKHSESGAPEGSWTCGKCGNLNYPFRTVCNRKGCGKERPASDN